MITSLKNQLHSPMLLGPRPRDVMKKFKKNNQNIFFEFLAMTSGGHFEFYHLLDSWALPISYSEVCLFLVV